MIECAGLKGILYSAVCHFSIGVLHVTEVNIELSYSFVEVMMPNLHPKHKVSASLSPSAEWDGKRVVNDFYAGGGADWLHIECIDDFVVEYGQEGEDEGNGQEPT